MGKPPATSDQPPVTSYNLQTLKIAVLADIHANYRALLAVADDIMRWQADAVVVAGDVVNRGPMPVESLAFVQRMQKEHNWLVTRGNHEDYVIEHAMPGSPRSGMHFEIIRQSFWTYQKLGDVSALQAMPFFVELQTPGGCARVAHASMRGIRDGIYRQTPDEWYPKLCGEPSPAAFVVGHTHVPLIKSINNVLVMNVGAAGLPFDGDTRAAYGRLTLDNDGWHAEVIRLNYDHARAERDYFESGFMDEVGPIAGLILEEHRTGRSTLFQWMSMYYQDVLAGKISIEQATRAFLQIPRNQRKIYG